MDLLDAAAWLTDRDDRICLDLYEHRVLTAWQIAELHFTDPRVARKRLAKLFRRGVLNRFRPRVPVGSAPFHYVLGELGMQIAAAILGLEPKRLRERLEHDAALPRSQRLDHLVQVNEFFVILTAACRREDGFGLREWWGERSCAIRLPTRGRPDGLGRVVGPGGACTFLLELDRGTERGDRLKHKLYSFASLGRRHDSPDAILFVFPTEDRETRARRKLDTLDRITVATSHWEKHGSGPLARIWLPVNGERRLSLIELSKGVGLG